MISDLLQRLDLHSATDNNAVDHPMVPGLASGRRSRPFAASIFGVTKAVPRTVNPAKTARN
jgi:hypothetical protein